MNPLFANASVRVRDAIIRVAVMLCICIRAAAQEAGRGDIVINEILFNPVKDGYDYVEGFNRSSRPLDLSSLWLARRNLAGEITVKRKIGASTLLLESGGYFVITPNETWLRQHYHTGAATVCHMAAIPSFPDDEGIVVFLNSQDTVVDEVHYHREWHFPLISDPSGVALERMDPHAASQDPNNWTSASSSSGHGTPGFVNSHFLAAAGMEGEMVIAPAVFSPDNDGSDDQARIHFQLSETDYVVNLTVFDSRGRRVRHLLKNQLLGARGQYTWDGLDEESRVLPQGIYILKAELFNMTGGRKSFRRTLVLAHR